jgi:magnesium transporter
VIVDCGVYREGRRDDADHSLEGVAAKARAGAGFAWIGLFEPTAEEFEHAAHEFDLHELLVEDVLKAHQRAKLERFDDVSFVVFKTATYRAPDEVLVGEIQLILGDSFVITVRHGEATPLTPVRRKLERLPEQLVMGPTAVLYAVADEIVDAYLPVITELEVDVEEAEQAVFSDDRLNPAERIFGLKRQVLELLRNLMPTGDVLDDLQQPDARVADPDLLPYLRDVADHARRTISRLEVVRDLLSDALNANLAQVSVRQNNDMRTISAWAALIAAPTMLAGVWGMNFTHMPELDWWLGYPIALGTMVLAVALLFRRFKRVGWL